MRKNKSALFSWSGFFSVLIAVIGLFVGCLFTVKHQGIVLGETSGDAPVSLTADTESPSRPSELKAVIEGDSSIALSWTVSSDNIGVSGYAVYRNGGVISTTSQNHFLDKNVSPGMSYEYAVIAGDFSGNKSEKSSTERITLPVVHASEVRMTPVESNGDRTPPSRPSRLLVSILNQRTVQVKWSASSDAVGVIGYQLFRNGKSLAFIEGLFYVDQSVYGGQEYRYSVEAVDAARNKSQRSEEQKIVVPLITVQTGSTTDNPTWTVHDDGTTLIVKNSKGEVIHGQSILRSASDNTMVVEMDDATKERIAKNALLEAIQSGIVSEDKKNMVTENLTPTEFIRLPESQSLDFDNDGLSNADEIRMESDPYNKDTDRDGFNDGDEVLSRHDPKRFSPGDNRDKVEIEDVRESIAIDVAQSQKGDRDQAKKKDDQYQVKNVELIRSDTPDTKDTVRLSGKALPNAVITLYVYSTPTIVVVKADSLGNWSYDLDQDLADGNHEAYVAVTDATGKVTSYGEGIGFVKTAEAITIHPIIEVAEAVSENQSPLKRSQIEYFFAAFIAILFFSGAALIVVSRKGAGPPSL